MLLFFVLVRQTLFARLQSRHLLLHLEESVGWIAGYTWVQNAWDIRRQLLNTSGLTLPRSESSLSTPLIS